MIDVFYYSIAGKKQNQVVDDIILTLTSADYVPIQDKKILNHSLEVAKAGTYPSTDYYSTFYSKPEFVYKALAEIVTYSKKVIDFYKKQDLQRKVISAINESESSTDLVNKLSILSEDRIVDEDDDLGAFEPILYSDNKDKPEQIGVNSGVPEIDALTNGFQRGTIASYCGFTAHGKSTFTVSTLYKNAKEGKKSCLVSLEMAPEILWAQFQARYLYEEKGVQVTAHDLIHRKVTSDLQKKIEEYDEDFRRDICSNLLIIDESVLTKNIVLSYKALNKLFRKIDQKLEGLDFIAWDHVGQLELLFPECGNKIIKQIQSATKTFVNSSGEKATTLFAVQTNREGEKRARKRGGVYDMQAISDLNEVERSSSYVLFMYTSDDMKVVQETKISLSKNRLGSVTTEPIVTSFNPSVCVVGSTIEKIEITDDIFGGMDQFDFGADDF